MKIFKNIMYIFVFVVLMNIKLHSNWINPDNQGWTTIDSMFVGKIDSNFTQIPKNFKIIKINEDSFIYAVKNDYYYPAYFFLRRTDNAGKDWYNIYVDSIYKPNKYKVIDRMKIKSIKNNILLSCDSTKIQRSTDNGKTFSYQIMDSLVNNRMSDLEAKDNLVLTLYPGMLFKSTDYGASWNKLWVFIGNNYYNPFEVSICDSLTYFVCAYKDPSYDNYYLLTNDGGNSWEQINVIKQDSDTILRRFDFINSKVGYGFIEKQIKKGSSFYNYTLMKTTDSGRNWFKVFKSTDSAFIGIRALYILDENHLAFATYTSIFYFENDLLSKRFDISMEKIQDFSRYPINDLFLTKDYKIFATYGNKIIKYDPATSVEENNLSNIISPNPASDYIEISLDSPSNKRGLGGVSLEIFNIFGESITTTPPFVHPFELEGEKIKIDISKLVPGVYFIKIGDRFEKFIKI